MSKHIYILALDNCLASSITLPSEMFGAAISMLRAHKRGKPAANIYIAASKPGPVVTAGGVEVIAKCQFDDIQQGDLAIIPALWRNPEQTLSKYTQLLPLLRKLHKSGCLLCSVGTGSWFLAEAGLLNQKPATTHWNYFNAFSQRFPKVQLKHQHLITQSENIYCVGSVNSLADILVHFTHTFFGKAIAQHVEKQFSPESRQPFEHYVFSERLANTHHDELIIQIQQTLAEDFSKPVIIAELAKSLGLSTRTLNRRFKNATGISPSQYLRSLRIESAKELLRNSNLSIAEVAAKAGYTDTSRFAYYFRNETSLSPRAYRVTVRGKLFSVV